VRLGQLARQLDIKPENIISYLEKEKQLTIKTHPNSKIEDNLVDGIITHFAPKVETAVASEKQEEVIKEVKVIKKKAAPKKEKVVEEIVVVEHIETPTTNIAGPKIIGKIDLPDKSNIQVEVDGVVYDQEFLDKKKKDEQQAERERKAAEKEAKRQEEQEKKRLALEKRKIEEERQAMLENEKNNILTAEEEKKKAIIEKAIREREERLEKKRKERQKEFYKQQLAAAAAQKKKQVKAKTIDKSEEIEVKAAVPTVEEVQETSIIKRFIKWLNT
jgi:translation initiation factor IF-2